MPARELHYHWEYDLKSSPEKLWPFVADTNRFNRDTGVPSVEPAKTTRGRLKNARRRLRLSMYGMAVEWEEQPFEWIRPTRFGVARTYSKGPITEMRALVELKARADGGTRLSYDFQVKPRSLVGGFLVSLQIKLSTARRFARAFRSYDQLVSTQLEVRPETEVELDSAAQNRLEVIAEKLLAEGAEAEVVERLVNFVSSADDFYLGRIRPYALADEWELPRRAVLEACMRSTRFGLLDLQWELLCPLCRGAGETGKSLSEIKSQ